MATSALTVLVVLVQPGMVVKAGEQKTRRLSRGTGRVTPLRAPRQRARPAIKADSGDGLRQGRLPHQWFSQARSRVYEYKNTRGLLVDLTSSARCR